MTVKINDITLNLPDGSSLQDAINAKEIVTKGIATAVNGKVIPATDRESHTLIDGDDIVIIKAFYGG